MERNPLNRDKFKTPEYYAWANAKQRCLNPKCPDYKNYGARGVRIAEEWLKDFAAFREHIGPKPSPLHSLDRIDNSLGYVPGNVRWATRKEQNSNRRSCHKGDGYKTGRELAEKLGKNAHTVRRHLRRNQ